MFDKHHIGHRFEPYTVEVEKGFLRLFAEAIGEEDPVYSDEAAAKAAGYRSIPAPPTYISCLQGLAKTSWPAADLLGFEKAHALHGEQSFEYFAPICAGDRLTLREQVVELLEKKGGTLNFVVTETEVRNEAGSLLALSRETIVVRSE